MKVAFIYDRINKFGGAERVLLSLHKLYPLAPIFTLVHEPKTSTWAKEIKIVPTFLNKCSFLRNRHELLAPIAPMAFESHDLSAYDVVISITSSDAKAVLTKPGQLHICYCLTPTRYFWSGENEYRGDWKYRLIPKTLRNYLKSIDLIISNRPDHYLSISNEVRNRVKKYYIRNSMVIYPPIEDKFYTKSPISHDNRDYYLIVSRLVPYKRVDLAIKVMNRLNKPLIVVGTGSQSEYLKKIAGKNINFTGAVDDSRLRQFYLHAKAVIFPQEEDFGLVPLEAQASGTPVIGYKKGGALETVIHGKTGFLFDEQSETSLAQAIDNFEKLKIDPQACIANASKFTSKLFEEKFSEEVKTLWENHRLS